MPPHQPARPSLPSFFFPVTLVLTACLCVLSVHADDAPPPPKGKGPPPAQAMPIPNMEAAGQFFSNTLDVNVHFGHLPRPGHNPNLANSGTDTPDNTPPPPDAGTPSGGRRKGGGGGPGGGHNGGASGGRGPTSGGGSGDYSGDPLMRGVPDISERTPNIHAEHNPATQLRLTLTNRSTALITVEVLDFNSVLGNFAVKPDKITITPGQTAEAEPMVSQLGIPTEDLPIKIRLNNGTASEQQTIMLKMLPAPSAQPLPAAPNPH